MSLIDDLKAKEKEVDEEEKKEDLFIDINDNKKVRFYRKGDKLILVDGIKDD